MTIVAVQLHSQVADIDFVTKEHVRSRTHSE